MDTDALFEELYAELKKIAAIRMRGELREHTLQTTALLHEAYLRLSRADGDRWHDRTHFLATAALTMRRILAEHARRRNRRVSLMAAGLSVGAEIPDTVEYLEFDRALAALAKEHPRPAQVIQYRYILGLAAADTAGALGVSERTVRGDQKLALAWLKRRLATR
jgi:RNA polymerase sigma factor (TIGR02999 family)